MTRIWTSLAFVALLAACGVDGEPRPPEPKQTGNVRVSGSAAVGVSVSSNGVHPSGSVGLSRGPVHLSVGF
nr:hypothetical protein [Thalassococcus sp. S3]